jgi:hypothetical protein
MLEFVMADGFKLQIPASYSYDDISRQIAQHEAMARRNLVGLRELDSPAIRITGPEGLAFYFNPRSTPDLNRGSLLDLYSADEVEQMMAGKYEGKMPPDVRLILAGKSKEEADALLSLNLEYVARKAFADALNKREVDRLVKLADEKRKPLMEPQPVSIRIAEAKAKVDRERGGVCPFSHCGASDGEFRC